MPAEILLTNARIVDGTGAPWFRGSIAISDGRIDQIFNQQYPGIVADKQVNLDGAMACPGFIDLHSHSDLQVFADPTLEPKVRQGITTEILGQDGFSMAPMFRDGGTDEWENHLTGLAGTTDTNWTWGRVDEYLDAIDENGTSLNLGLLVGHGTVRYNVLGMDDRSPTDAELNEMSDLVADALKNGCIGFSTGLVYPPQVNASTKEVQTLAEQLAPMNRPFVAHIRSEGQWIWEAFDEFVDIGAESDIPLHISHFKVSGRSVVGQAPRLLSLFDAARDRGVDITADKYPYAAGNTMLTSVLPPWVHAEGPEKLREYLSDPEARDRMHRDIEEWRIDGWENNAAKTGWDNLVVTNIDEESLTHCNGETVADLAQERDDRPVDVVCDLLKEGGTGISIITHSQSEADVREMLTHEAVGIGTDGLFGGSPHPRTYGTYPRILGHYVRDENLLSAEEAIRKMTSLPARAMGLQRKGVLRPGMDADVVVFEPNVVEAKSSYARPRQSPTGISHVLVNGEFVVQNAELTNALPGSTIRK